MAGEAPDVLEQCVAIIGMSGRFPGASSPRELWANLVEGRDCIETIGDEELRADGLPEELMGNPQTVKRAGILRDTSGFDAAFFGYTPREAVLIDPQQRIFLECAWEALEDSGYVADSVRGPVAVFAGSGLNYYFAKNILSHRGRFEDIVDLVTFIGNDKDYLCSRVSYKFGFRGPSICVQTACSTSLVAVAMGYQALLTGQCDLALCGGVSLQSPRSRAYLFQKGGILSRDGMCRPFDKAATGIVFGEGCGVVVLKRLADANRDRDHIYAVVRAAVVNNDGSSKAGYTAPGVDAQAELIELAQALAAVSPEDIRYVEAHGTGTPLGDAIEVAALTRAFRKGTEARQYCGLGSIKSNIGHLDAAAGVAGLIKTALSLEQGYLPPTLHYREPNPQLELETSPFQVVSAGRPWERSDRLRCAAVSSFGMGGTNAHVIVQEAPEPPALLSRRKWQVFPLSARSPDAVRSAAGRLATHLAQSSDPQIANVAYTLQVGRKPLRYRHFAVAPDRESLLDTLRERDHGIQGDGEAIWAARGVAFMFPGQGSQYAGMCKGLYTEEPHFREYCDRAREAVYELAGFDLFGALFPEGTQPVDTAATDIDQTQIAQPALYTVEYALAQLLMEYGVRPAALIGHSVGEFTAAAVAGLLTYEEGLRLVIARGRLMQSAPPGAMLSVALSEPEVQTVLPRTLSLALHNGPQLCVVSGPVEDVAAFERELTGRHVRCRPLRTTRAFHSPMMESAARAFHLEVAAVRLGEPRIPWVSNLTGVWADQDHVRTPEYWVAQIRQPVRFSEGIEVLLADDKFVLMEVGPGKTLCTLAAMQPRAGDGPPPIATGRVASDKTEDVAVFWRGIGQLWAGGGRVDWAAVHADEKLGRASLPTYPFEHQRFWIPMAAAGAATNAGLDSSSLSEMGLASASPDPADSRPPAEHGSRRPHKGRAGVTPATAMSRTELEHRLRSLWRAVLGRDVDLHDDFFAAGGHSALAAELFVKLQRDLAVVLPLSCLYSAPTVSLLADVIQQGSQSGLFQALVRVRTGDDVLPLFLVHGAEGNVLLYRQLASHLAPHQTVYGLQAMGVDGRGGFLTRVEDMAELYVREIRQVRPKGPYALGGYCMGGMVALAMAQRLQRENERVVFLGMLESYNARGYGYRPNKTKDAISAAQNLTFHVLNAVRAHGHRWGFMVDKYRTETLRLQFRWKALVGHLRSLTGAEALEDLPHFRLSPINDRAYYDYVPEPYVGRISVYRPRVSFYGHDPVTCGWDRLSADIRVTALPCYPRGMLVEPFVGLLGEALQAGMDEARAHESASASESPRR